MASIIILNGTSSSGKSTLAKVLRAKLDTPFWHLASDQFVAADMLPKRVNDGGAFDWEINRPIFFDAFHGCVKAILDAGNNIILDHIIESQQWYRHLQRLLNDEDVFFVGIHCPIHILKERERTRSDQGQTYRYLGEAEFHLQNVHSYSAYDLEIDTSKQTIEAAVDDIINAWQVRRSSKFLHP